MTVLSVLLTSTVNEPEVVLIVSLMVVLSVVRRVVIVAFSSSLTLPFVKNAFPDAVATVRAFWALKEISFTVNVSTPTVVTVVSRVVEKIVIVASRRTALRLSMSPPLTVLST